MRFVCLVLGAAYILLGAGDFAGVWELTRQPEPRDFYFLFGGIMTAYWVATK